MRWVRLWLPHRIHVDSSVAHRRDVSRDRRRRSAGHPCEGSAIEDRTVLRSTLSTRPHAMAADLRASPIRLVYDAPDGGEGDPGGPHLLGSCIDRHPRRTDESPAEDAVRRFPGGPLVRPSEAQTQELSRSASAGRSRPASRGSGSSGTDARAMTLWSASTAAPRPRPRRPLGRRVSSSRHQPLRRGSVPVPARA